MQFPGSVLEQTKLYSWQSESDMQELLQTKLTICSVARS